jgi:hypothetical protein
MDEGLGTNGIDGFVAVTFAGNDPLKTKFVTSHGKANLTCVWNEELWLPVLTPTMSNKIEVAVWDYDKLRPNDRVGTILLNFEDVCNGKMKAAKWYSVYGAPDGVKLGANKNMMNRLPSKATNYRCPNCRVWSFRAASCCCGQSVFGVVLCL